MAFAMSRADDPGFGSGRTPPDLTRARTEERALILRVRDGDTQAFAKLVQQHMNRVTRLAYHLVGSHDVAEDVAQTVFVQLWDHRDRLDPDRPLRPYLLRAVHNRALDERKAEGVRARYRVQVQGEALAGSIGAAVPSPESGVLTTTTVQAALRRLSERRRLALRLWFEESLTHEEIAAVLGVSLQATDRLIRRALAEIREILLVSK